jgi:hypothetical protein
MAARLAYCDHRPVIPEQRLLGVALEVLQRGERCQRRDREHSAPIDPHRDPRRHVPIRAFEKTDADQDP